MFGVGFSEIICVVVIAIIVLGPDKLPKAGKAIGKFLRQYKILKDDFMLRINTPVSVGTEPSKPTPPVEVEQEIAL